MLTQTLRDLQRDGYIEREVFPTKPPSVEYRMTDLGYSLFEPLSKVLSWAETNHAFVKAARVRFDEGELAWRGWSGSITLNVILGLVPRI
jgi:DNA-binding HxlR family transcriptional regulator